MDTTRARIIYDLQLYFKANYMPNDLGDSYLSHAEAIGFLKALSIVDKENKADILDIMKLVVANMERIRGENI